MKAKILVIDDELDILKAIKRMLAAEGFEVATSPNAEEGMREIRRFVPHLLLLDVRLTGMSGFDLCKQIRADEDFASLPVMFLTTKKDESDKVLGLELGGDDYLTKPFSKAELMARIRAILRRSDPGGEVSVTLTSGPIIINMARRSVEASGKPVKLTPKEYDLLCLFIRKRGRVLTRDFLMETVWGNRHSSESRTLDSHIRTLRTALGPLRACLETVEGLGYKWEDPG